MIVYFVRHGLAEDRHLWAPRDDYDRPLTTEGIAKMEKSAQTMRKLGVRPALILTSPLIRARQTADIVGEALAREVIEEPDAGPGFDLRRLADLLARYGERGDLMVVGHEPDFSITVEGLTGGGRVVVKKGSLIRVDVTNQYPPRGELAWSIPPRFLAL